MRQAIKQVRTRITDCFFGHCDLSAGPESCWPYLRCKNRLGYGRVWVDGKCWEAHRYAYTLAKGPIPEGMLIIHSCDFPSCCNPDHLRTGTHHLNAHDREVRGRGGQPKGEDAWSAKLTTRDVIFIRRCRDLYNSEEMAKMLGVQRAAVCKILQNRTWKHVGDTPLGEAAALDRVRH